MDFFFDSVSSLDLIAYRRPRTIQQTPNFSITGRRMINAICNLTGFLVQWIDPGGHPGTGFSRVRIANVGRFRRLGGDRDAQFGCDAEGVRKIIPKLADVGPQRTREHRVPESEGHKI
jgi:hypothetical protein